MKIDQVAKLPPEARFLYWIKERHAIYLKRKAGKPKPWTDDTILQSYFFTNPYREHDKTTVWFRDNVRGPLRDSPKVLMATVIFRWFNRITTGELLLKNDLLTNWNSAIAINLLGKAGSNGPIFTGAYMIKAGNGPPGCKLPNVCKSINNVWKERERLVELCNLDCRLERLCSSLKRFPNLGGFMSYEIACDLRYTGLLENSPDINNWSNLGPGAARGIQRIDGIPIIVPKSGMKDARPKPPADWLDRFAVLLRLVRVKLRCMPKFEMREVEHSLCEWDKYERLLWGEGRSKRRFDGV